MPESQGKRTTAKNLEDKFDRSENVLDYFEVRKARVVDPQSKHSMAKGKFGSSLKRNSNRQAAVVREKSARYHKKK